MEDESYEKERQTEKTVQNLSMDKNLGFYRLY